LRNGARALLAQAVEAEVTALLSCHADKQVHYFIADPPRFFPCIGCVNSRTRSMKRSTTGLTVRFFSVNIANCHGRTDNSTGNIFTGDWDASDRGIAAMN
jgi:hypothetical protein